MLPSHGVGAVIAQLTVPARGWSVYGGHSHDRSRQFLEILDKFGTFRFLLADLVPLQLIHKQLVHDSSLEA